VSLHALNSGLSVSQLTDFDRIIIFDVLVGQRNINVDRIIIFDVLAGQRNINVLSQETLHQD